MTTVILLFTAVDGCGTSDISAENAMEALWCFYDSLSSSRDSRKQYIRTQAKERAERAGGVFTPCVRGGIQCVRFVCGCPERTTCFMRSVTEFTNPFTTRRGDPANVMGGHILPRSVTKRFGFTFNSLITACCRCEGERGSDIFSSQTRRDVVQELAYITRSPKHMAFFVELLKNIGMSYDDALRCLSPYLSSVM